ncbi:hypothetical protein SKAU_G00159220 [Synaphobranchus kaupii]|uniref:Uncharacterized protein n=1 Tax=Synaphobranchus kaupii TaxID=118154 RepID=A0A9Q1FIM1_SYNKA|nr:hypothetical protein SKAU_G00159220 [Synaphobranchus kaupii]
MLPVSDELEARHPTAVCECSSCPLTLPTILPNDQGTLPFICPSPSVRPRFRPECPSAEAGAAVLCFLNLECLSHPTPSLLARSEEGFEDTCACLTEG